MALHQGTPDRGAVQLDAHRRRTGTIDNEAALWASFAGAQHASEFCQSWLAIQCRSLGDAAAGLLLLQEERGRFAPAAIWPERTRDITHLAGVAEQALTQRKGIVLEGPPKASARGEGGPQVAYPIEIKDQLYGVVVVELRAGSSADLQTLLRQLHWGAGWLETLFRRKQADVETHSLARMAFALDIVAVASEHRVSNAAAVAVATELATRLECRRVSLGLRKKGGVRLRAISHSAWFQEKAQVVSAIENAMEEASDQDAAVVVPSLASTGKRIALAHGDLARLSGAAAVASVILSSAGRPVGVLTFERDGGDAFDQPTLELLETVGALLGPVMEAKAEASRLVAGRIVNGAAKGLTTLLGPRRPALKLAAASLLTLAAYLAVATGDFRVAAKATIEGSVQRAAVAPFEGYIAAAPLRAGDVVEEGQVLARIDDRELALEAIRWRSEREQQLLKHQEALGKHDRSTARVMAALVKQTEAQLALVEDKLARAAITAPFRGMLVSGDLSQMLGSPVEKGKVLFEIAPLDSFRVILQVDERDILHVSPGRSGTLVLTGLTDQSLAVRVTKVTPVANAADGRNFFRVEAELQEPGIKLRPGMEGLAKLSVEERPLLWIWTRSLVDWVRITAWTWLP